MYRITGYYNEFAAYEDATDFYDRNGLDYGLIYDEDQADN